MSRRPLSITLVGWLFVVAGATGLAYHAGEFRTRPPGEFALVCLIRLLAVVGGAFLLRGRSWARWLLIGWLAYHAVLSAFHSPVELAVHAGLLAVIGYLLLRPRASAYFRSARGGRRML